MYLLNCLLYLITLGLSSNICLSLLDGTGLEKMNIESEQHNKVLKADFGINIINSSDVSFYLLFLFDIFLYFLNEERVS